MSKKWLLENLNSLEISDDSAQKSVLERSRNVLRPVGALQRLDNIAAWVASWQSTIHPSVERPAAVVFAADHGVARAGTSAYPTEVTAAMLQAYRAGKSTLSAFAQVAGAAVHAIDVGVGKPTGDIQIEAAMSAEDFSTALSIGRNIVDSIDADLLVIGEMGIGNTTIASALCSKLIATRQDLWVGRGTGVDDDGLRRKIEAVRVACNRVSHLADPLEIFRELGGNELVAMAGAVVAARQKRIPVIIDGFVVSAAILPLFRLNPNVLEHCLFSHCSADPGHRALLEFFGQSHLLDLQMRLGEGSGAMAVVPLVKMACLGVTAVPTFDEWFNQ
jgi:nicotinate-nucleotide--dimethylbenzimidazole phosphoribosyltransferase